MTTRRKLTAVAVAVSLALLGIGVSGAQAALEFEAAQTVPRGGSEYEWTYLPETPIDVTQVAEEKIAMSVGGMTISCSTATASSTLAEGISPTLALTPSFSGCKAGGFATEVANKGCTFALHNLAESGSDSYTAQADIGCSPEGQILATVTIFGITTCLIHVYPQTNLKTVKVTNQTEASPPGLKIKNEIETLKVVVENGKVACSITPGTYTNAKYSGSTTATATGTTGEVPPAPPHLFARDRKKFHFLIGAELTTVIGKAESPQEFTFDVGKVICKKAQWQEIGLTPEKPFVEFSSADPYPECEFNGVEKAEFIMAKFCVVTLKAGDQAGTSYIGLYTLVCPANAFSEIKFTGCTIRLFKQKGPGNTGYLRRVTLENLGTLQTREIRAKMEVYGLEYEEVGAACEHPGVRKTNGKLQGKVFFAGSNALQTEQRPVWMEITK